MVRTYAMRSAKPMTDSPFSSPSGINESPVEAIDSIRFDSIRFDPVPWNHVRRSLRALNDNCSGRLVTDHSRNDASFRGGDYIVHKVWRHLTVRVENVNQKIIPRSISDRREVGTNVEAPVLGSVTGRTDFDEDLTSPFAVAS
jgi:hypothetical protein